MKKIVNAAMRGIYLSALVFLLACMNKGFSAPEAQMFTGKSMAYSCIAVLVTGAGFGLPSLIYRTKLPTALKVLIHMGTGVIVMLAVSIAVGWIDLARGWLPCLIAALTQTALAFLIWVLTCVRIRRDAKQMNERIAEKQ
ncbi:MAG: DUF3021 domain-containing protein [Clostridia bacterium]|nr:DUF3021 domain-containing protein [Clostridia bacterium]MBR5713209.1 DUF3021 domain-containing protein [Clostridia bacterium]